MSARRPRLTPAVADLRRAVREHLAEHLPVNTAKSAGSDAQPLLLVALSGGPDSLALAAAVAFEAPRAGFRAGAVIVDHNLQEDSGVVAQRAAEQARQLGLAPVTIERVSVEGTGGLEATARQARYRGFDRVADELDACAVLLGHTLDDQAETVLLGLARGSGGTSLAGMAAVNGRYHRPLLGVTRVTTAQACSDAGLDPWLDPHNTDQTFLRVRVRTTVLPTLERELGPGITEALARSAAQSREDAEALDDMVTSVIDEVIEPVSGGIALAVAGLIEHPAAIRNRMIRAVALTEFGVSLSREHTLAVAALVTDWHGQAELHLPSLRVRRETDQIIFALAPESPSRETRP